MSIVMGTPVIKNLTPSNDPPYDGTVNVLSDRKCGWRVTHALLHPQWIEGIPTRILADQILEAFEKIYLAASNASMTQIVVKKKKKK